MAMIRPSEARPADQVRERFVPVRRVVRVQPGTRRRTSGSPSASSQRLPDGLRVVADVHEGPHARALRPRAHRVAFAIELMTVQVQVGVDEGGQVRRPYAGRHPRRAGRREPRVQRSRSAPGRCVRAADARPPRPHARRRSPSPRAGTRSRAASMRAPLFCRPSASRSDTTKSSRRRLRSRFAARLASPAIFFFALPDGGCPFATRSALRARSPRRPATSIPKRSAGPVGEFARGVVEEVEGASRVPCADRRDAGGFTGIDPVALHEVGGELAFGERRACSRGRSASEWSPAAGAAGGCTGSAPSAAPVPRAS